MADRYELRQPLGSGGMAAVYRAWDRQSRRWCAVKVLADHLARHDEFRERFQREAEAAKDLVHPHIVRVYAHGGVDGLQYIAMECVGGGTLDEILRARGPLPEADALRIAAEAADALAYAHERHVVHRDVKPHNILMTEDGHVKVADFGIARILDGTFLTQTGSVLGSAPYIAPEQVRGEQAGPPADQYALGVVLYQMLSGRVPFEGDAPVAVALKHLNEPPPDLHWLRPDLSVATVAVVRRLLAKSPELRYPNAAALAQDLTRISMGLHAGTPDATVRLALADLGAARTPPSAESAPLTPGNGWHPTERRGRRGARVSDTGRLAVAGPSRARWPLAVLLCLAAAAAIAAAGVSGNEWWAPHVQAPLLVGQPVDAASRMAQALHLGVTVASQRQDSTAAPGLILGQDPPPGRSVPRGTAVRVTVSNGSGVVPNLRGVWVSQARYQLAAAGLRLGHVTYTYDQSIASGAVISQSAVAGTHLAPNGPVDLVASHGPPPAAPVPAPLFPIPGTPGTSPSTPLPGLEPRHEGDVVVPDLLGMSVQQAQQALAAAGLEVGSTNYAYDDQAAAGTVMRQSAAAGTNIQPNESVDLVVSQGPPPSPAQPSAPSGAPTSAPVPGAPPAPVPPNSSPPG